MWWIWLILLLSACGGSIWFYQQLQATTEKKNLLYLRICVGVVAFLFLVQLASCLFSCGYTFESRKTVETHLSYAGEYVGEYIVKHKIASGKTGVLVVDFPAGADFPGSNYSTKIIEGLSTAFKDTPYKICGVARPEIDKTAKNYWLSSAEWDRVVGEYPEAGVVVSLVGLPKELKRIKFWFKKDAPKVILMRGNLKFLKKCFEYKLIIAALICVPGQNIKNEKIPSDGINPAILKKYFEMVTPANIDLMVKKHPSLF